MDRATRIVLVALVIAAVVCALLAMRLVSEWFALAAAALTTVAVVVGLSTPKDPDARPARSRTRFAWDPTSSATVDVIDAPRPFVFDSGPAQSAYQPVTPVAPAPVHAPVEPPSAPSPALVFSPKLPPGSKPGDVIRALVSAAQSAGEPVAGHLWLEDPVTDTLRLVYAQGKAAPGAVPVSLTSGLLGASLADGCAHLGPLEGDSLEALIHRRWRYVIPLVGPDIRGVAAVDFEGFDEPDRAVLTTASATLRASLSGALALHVAENETNSARTLVAACARLAKVIDPADVLRTALDSAMELAQAQTGSIMLIDPQTGRMRIAIARGLPEDVVAETEIGEGDGIAGWVLASRQPLVVEDLNENWIRSRRHGIRSAVCVPLADDRGIVGVLNIGCKTFHARFSAAHLESLDAMGQTVVTALRNAWAKSGAQDLYFDTLKSLALALEARDPYAKGGTERVVELVEALAAWFGMSREETVALRIAAMLRDVGMSAAGTGVPVAEGPLTTVEWGMLKMHPIIAAEIMAQAPSLAKVIPIVYHHHEHFDGSGYVTGLAGTKIPLGARILSVVDAFVAMTSPRPYRSALTHAQAIGELERGAGAQFDPTVVRALVEIVGPSGTTALPLN